MGHHAKTPGCYLYPLLSLCQQSRSPHHRWQPGSFALAKYRLAIPSHSCVFLLPGNDFIILSGKLTLPVLLRHWLYVGWPVASQISVLLFCWKWVEYLPFSSHWEPLTISVPCQGWLSGLVETSASSCLSHFSVQFPVSIREKMHYRQDSLKRTTLVLSLRYWIRERFSAKVKYNCATIVWYLFNFSEYLEKRRVETTHIKWKYRLCSTSVN